jgi:sugar phosphate isomerase/epimerase
VHNPDDLQIGEREVVEKIGHAGGPETNRRDFLLGCAAGMGGLASAMVAGPTWAVEPNRPGLPAAFKFSLAAYSYRRLLSGTAAELTLFDFAHDCAAFGLGATELTSYYFPQPVTEDYLRQLKRHCFRLGLDISGTAVGNDFGHPPGPERERQIANVKRWVEHARTLGAPVIRIFAGHQHQGATEQETHRLIVDGIGECCQHAGQHGIHLALENHGGPTATAEGLLALVRDIDSPWFGVNLDTGNFHSEDLYGELERVAPYAVNVQVKATVSGPDRQKRAADYDRLAGILRGANYRGYVVLEYEEEGDPREACRVELEQLRSAFA